MHGSESARLTFFQQGADVSSEKLTAHLRVDRYGDFQLTDAIRPALHVSCANSASRIDTLRLITEGEHLHSTDPHHGNQFEQLCCRLGIGEPAEHVSW